MVVNISSQINQPYHEIRALPVASTWPSREKIFPRSRYQTLQQHYGPELMTIWCVHSHSLLQQVCSQRVSLYASVSMTSHAIRIASADITRKTSRIVQARAPMGQQLWCYYPHRWELATSHSQARFRHWPVNPSHTLKIYIYSGATQLFETCNIERKEIGKQGIRQSKPKKSYMRNFWRLHWYAV